MIEGLIEYRDVKHAMHVIGMKISWLGKTINGGHCRGLKEGVRVAKTPEEVLGAIERWRDSDHVSAEIRTEF